MLVGFQIATACIGFSIIPALAGDVWFASPESFRWIVYASQVTLLFAGFIAGRIPRSANG